MTVAAISSGRMSFRVPLLALPTGVLNAVTTTASFIIHLPFGCFSLLLNSYENGRNPSPDRQGGAHRPIASTTPNGRGSVFFVLCGADLGGIGDSVQFLNGFPFCNICWMRSRVFRCPQRLRKASRSRSRMSCSLTSCGVLQSPPQRM